MIQIGAITISKKYCHGCKYLKTEYEKGMAYNLPTTSCLLKRKIIGINAYQMPSWCPVKKTIYKHDKIKST